MSAYMEYFPRTKKWRRFGKIPNRRMLAEILLIKPDLLVCENMQSMGMAVGRSVFETVRFIGRIEQLCFSEGIPFALIYRSQVKKCLCAGVQRPKDVNVRASLIAMYGERGTKAAPGGTFGIANDVWSALAIAHTYTVTLL